jgi:parvulin-like peptidyl-prolyl isomerase
MRCEATGEGLCQKAPIKGGADFVKLVKENSQDEASRDKDGDFATLRYGDNIPNAFRSAVFALKQGEVCSAPRKSPCGRFPRFVTRSITTCKSLAQTSG